MATVVSRPIASPLSPYDLPSSSLTSKRQRPPLSSTRTASSNMSNTPSDAGIAQRREQRSQQQLSAGLSNISRLRSASSSITSSNLPHYSHRRATSVSSANATSTLSSDHSPSTLVHAPNKNLLPYDLSANTSDPVLKPRKKSSASGVRPFFRRITSSDSPTHSLDLSRSAADQESGLGIYSSNLPSPDPTGEVVFSHGPARGHHVRSTSGTSQYSNISGHHRVCGPQLRNNTRPFTPPIAHSHAPSILESEYSGETPFEESEPRSRILRARTHSSPSTPPLRIQTSTSKLGQSYNMSPSIMEPLTPGSAKGSSVFKFRKDPIISANSVGEAQAAFEAHKREKEEKAEREALKAAERKERKRARTNSRTKPAFADSSAAAGMAMGMFSGGDEVPLAGSKEYSQLRADTDLPQTRQRPDQGKTRRQSHSKPSTWARFKLWLKFRVMKMKRRIGI